MLSSNNYQPSKQTRRRKVNNSSFPDDTDPYYSEIAQLLLFAYEPMLKEGCIVTTDNLTLEVPLQTLLEQTFYDNDHPLATQNKARRVA